MSGHTKEPWIARGPLVFFGNNEGGFDLRDCPEPEANARRIVYCVNALANVSTKWLEENKSIVVLGAPIADRFREIERQRDYFSAEAKRVDDYHLECLDEWGEKERQLQASLISTAKQREELIKALQYAIDIHSPGRTDGPTYHHVNQFLNMAGAAIAKAEAQ